MHVLLYICVYGVFVAFLRFFVHWREIVRILAKTARKRKEIGNFGENGKEGERKTLYIRQRICGFCAIFAESTAKYSKIVRDI